MNKLLKFCENEECKIKLFKTSEGYKCKHCDNYNPNEKKITRKPVYSDEVFPYVKNEYYIQKEIRNRLGFAIIIVGCLILVITGLYKMRR